MSTPQQKRRIHWTENPDSADGFPLAGVAWAPGGPVLAEIVPSPDWPGKYIARLDGRTIAFLPSPRDCRAALERTVARAHAAVAERKSRDAHV